MLNVSALSTPNPFHHVVFFQRFLHRSRRQRWSPPVDAEPTSSTSLLAKLLRRPWLIAGFVADLERLETSQPEHERVRNVLLTIGDEKFPEIETLCGAEALEKLTSPRHVRIAPGLRDETEDDIAAMSVAEELAKLTARRGARRLYGRAASQYRRPSADRPAARRRRCA